MGYQLQSFDWWILAAFSAVIFFLRYYFLDSQSLWQDELSEIRISSQFLPVQGCAYQSQPPFSCVLTRWGAILFGGLTEFSVRFHVLVSSVISSFVFFLSSLKILKNWKWALLAGLVYSVNPLVIQYGYEVRPLSLGLLTFNIYLFTLITSIQDQNNQNTTLKLLVILSGYFFLLSIGFQSVVFIGTVIFIFTIFGVKVKDKKLISLALLAFCSLILYIPLQLAQFNISSSAQIVPNNILELTNRFSSLVRPTLNSLVHLPLFNPYLIVILILTFLVVELKKSKKLIHESLQFVLMAVLLIAFYIFSILTFNLLVQDQAILAPRYFLIGWPLVLIASLSLLANLQKVESSFRFFKWLFVVFLVSTLGIVHLRYKVPQRPRIKQVYSQLSDLVNAADSFGRLCIRDSKPYCLAYHEPNNAAEIYVNTFGLSSVFSAELGPVAIFKHFSDPKKSGNLYLLIENDYAFIPLHILDIIKKTKNIDVNYIEGESLLVLKAGKVEQIEDWIFFLQEMNQFKETDPFFLELNFQLALIRKDKALLLETFDKWASVDYYASSQDPRRAYYWKITQQIFNISLEDLQEYRAEKTLKQIRSRPGR